MSYSQASRTVTVVNRGGLHARAATEVAKLARRFQATLTVVKNQQRADCVDVLQILSLGAAMGETLLLEATGEDAEAALEALAELLLSQFDDDVPKDGEQITGSDEPG